jgi:hypothetical protein
MDQDTSVCSLSLRQLVVSNMFTVSSAVEVLTASNFRLIIRLVD